MIYGSHHQLRELVQREGFERGLLRNSQGVIKTNFGAFSGDPHTVVFGNSAIACAGEHHTTIVHDSQR
jgi:hypothetical protein